MTICEHSGRLVLSCKVSDLCDCFDHPEADEAAKQAAADQGTTRAAVMREALRRLVAERDTPTADG